MLVFINEQYLIRVVKVIGNVGSFESCIDVIVSDGINRIMIVGYEVLFRGVGFQVDGVFFKFVNGIVFYIDGMGK